MDGSDITCTLQFYYSKNPLTQIYEFQDDNSENDIAELIGIRFDIISNGEYDEEKLRRDKEEKLEAQRITDLTTFLEILENEDETIETNIETNIRKNKKERRKAKLESRAIMADNNCG
jgi:hypothetical protein